MTSRPIRILQAEDSLGDAELTRVALAQGRVASQLSHVRDGIEALKYLRNEAPYEDAPRPDLVLLGQVFQNLVANAVKFHDSEAPQVRVSGRELDHGWEFTVEDNGIGIAPRDAERIFKMFQRLHDREAFEGTGIGLAICRKIIERHGGEIRVEPAEGGGSRFVFTLSSEQAGDSR